MPLEEKDKISSPARNNRKDNLINVMLKHNLISCKEFVLIILFDTIYSVPVKKHRLCYLLKTTGPNPTILMA